MIQIIIIPIVKEGSTTFIYLLLFRKYRNLLYRYTFGAFNKFFRFERNLIKTKNFLLKIKSTSINNTMMPLHEYIIRWLYARQELREKKRKEKERKRHKPSYVCRWGQTYKDKEQQAIMFNNGFCRCSNPNCRFYVSPDKLLIDLNEALQIKLAQNSKYDAHNLVEANDLILNEDNTEYDYNAYNKYEKEIKSLSVVCRECKKDLECEDLKKISYVDTQFNSDVIIYLHEKREKMVYLNIPVVEYENNCCS